MTGVQTCALPILLARGRGSRGGRNADPEPGWAENKNSGSFPSGWFSAVSLGSPPPRVEPRDPVPRAARAGRRGSQRGRRASSPGPHPSPRGAPRAKPPRFSIRWSRAARRLPPPLPPRRELRAGTLQRQEVNRDPGGGEAKDQPRRRWRGRRRGWRQSPARRWWSRTRGRLPLLWAPVPAAGASQEQSCRALSGLMPLRVVT